MPSRTGTKQASSDENGPSVETHFKDLMVDCTYDWVDPHACLPFTMTRPVSNSGVLKLMDLFDGSFDGDSINGGGISCGSATSILVRLDGTLLVHAGEYFRKKGWSETKVKDKLNSRTAWYGIVDGEHSHSAILRLMETKKRWAGYKWFVTIIRGGFDIERYRQLARMQNERHSSRFFVELTFFDTLSNMRTEYEKLSKTSSRVAGQDVVNAYCGYTVTSKKRSTLVQTANTVIRLPVSVIRTIGEICNAEHPELVLTNSKLNTIGATTISEAMRQVDCRVFRNFLHITSIKSAKAFMNAKHRNGERAQVCTLYRVQDLYRQRSFSKAIQPNELARQYELSLYSIEEEEKFLNYIRPDEWPDEILTVRENLLKTMLLSDEVELNHGNKEVLPCLISAFKRHLPAKYVVKQQRWEVENQVKKPTPTTSSGGPPRISKAIDNESGSSNPTETDLAKNSGSQQKSAHKESSKVDGQKSKHSNDGDKDVPEKDNNSNCLDQKLKLLREKGVNCYNLKWQEFSKEVWTIKNKRLDAIITEPPPTPSLSFIQNTKSRKETDASVHEELSSKDILNVVQSGKRFLKPGGYFIVLIEFEMFQEWYLSFKGSGFGVMKRPLTFCYKPDSVPRRPSEESDFPYGLEEYCIVARLSGSHPDGFNPNFKSNFNLIECSWSRRTSIVTNVDLPRNKLCYEKSTKPVRDSEKPINLLAEIIDHFVPPYGTTMDLFGGTLTLAIAALKTSRRCIVIENDEKCFHLAINRLSTLCAPVFKFVVNESARSSDKQMSTVTTSQSIISLKGTNGCCKSSQSERTSTNKNKRNFLKTALEETSKDVEEIKGRGSEPNDLTLETDSTEAQDFSSDGSEPQLKSLK